MAEKKAVKWIRQTIACMIHLFKDRVTETADCKIVQVKHFLPKSGVMCKQLFPHLIVLGTLSRKHENNWLVHLFSFLLLIFLKY
ncbi:Hypothetical protein ACI5QL_01852 [Bacillus velezensis]